MGQGSALGAVPLSLGQTYFFLRHGGPARHQLARPWPRMMGTTFPPSIGTARPSRTPAGSTAARASGGDRGTLAGTPPALSWPYKLPSFTTGTTGITGTAEKTHRNAGGAGKGNRHAGRPGIPVHGARVDPATRHVRNCGQSKSPRGLCSFRLPIEGLGNGRLRPPGVNFLAVADQRGALFSADNGNRFQKRGKLDFPLANRQRPDRQNLSDFGAYLVDGQFFRQHPCP